MSFSSSWCYYVMLYICYSNPNYLFLLVLWGCIYVWVCRCTHQCQAPFPSLFPSFSDTRFLTKPVVPHFDWTGRQWGPRLTSSLSSFTTPQLRFWKYPSAFTCILGSKPRPQGFCNKHTAHLLLLPVQPEYFKQAKTNNKMSH